MGRPLPALRTRGPGAVPAQGTDAGPFAVSTNRADVESPTPSPSRSPETTGRIHAAQRNGGEGVATGTARVRYRDARHGSDTLASRAGSHGANTLALAASGRTPTAAGWTPVETGGITLLTHRQR